MGTDAPGGLGLVVRFTYGGAQDVDAVGVKERQQHWTRSSET